MGTHALTGHAHSRQRKVHRDVHFVRHTKQTLLPNERADRKALNTEARSNTDIMQSYRISRGERQRLLQEFA
jgi:hypothetical protein